MENWITTLSNLNGIFAVAAWPNGSVGQILTLLAMTFSIVYHAIETKKHCMPGIKPFATGTQFQHHLCINLDRIAAGSLAFYLTYLVLSDGHWDVLVKGCLAISLNLISEIFRFFPSPFNAWMTKSWYVLWHSLWHLAAFHLSWTIAAIQ